MASSNDVDGENIPAFALVNCIASADADRLATELERQAFHILRLHGDHVTDKASFLKQAEADLPRPADLIPHNWDAFADCLWNGLYDLPEDQVALVWTEAQRMANGDLQDLLDAVRILSDLARQVMQAGGSFPRQMTLLLFLVGEGPQFRRL